MTVSPAAFAAPIERGDSDTSASTIRTAGAIGLVILVIAALIVPVLAVSTSTAAFYGTITWPNTVP